MIACAQGASETNISFVVDGLFLRKTLNVIHDSFSFGIPSPQSFSVRVGTVGSTVRSGAAVVKKNAGFEA